jgi:hypothetical protein
MARYRADELKSGDVSMLIGLLGKIGFLPDERGRMNLPNSPGKQPTGTAQFPCNMVSTTLE